jgi:hypothetical protein
MKDIKLTRKELYDLVWSEPMISLAKKYSMSDNGLRKICKRMNIPIPKTGHWQKIRYGKRLSITPLPSEYSGKDEINLSLRVEGDKSNSDSPSPLAILQKEIESDPKLPLIVPEKLCSPDNLVAAAKAILTNQKPDNFNYKGMVYSSRGTLDIRVTRENVGRALRFMDAFIKLMRARGHNVVVDNNHTYAIMGDEKMEISFKERTKRVKIKDAKYSWETSEYHPTGILSFKSSIFLGSAEWVDGKVLIENQLSKILAKLEISNKERKEHELRWQKQREEEEKKAQIKRDLEQKKETELAYFKNLLKKAHRWREVTLLRNYINDVEEKAVANNNLSEFQDWITWARKKVDWYDPNLKTEDELLMEVDKDSLTFKKKSSFY